MNSKSSEDSEAGLDILLGAFCTRQVCKSSIAVWEVNEDL